MNEILTAIILGFIGGLTPGPIIILSLSEILKSPTKGLSRGGMYVFVAGMTEFFIGLFLIFSSNFLNIPNYIFHILSIIGIFILLYLSYVIYKIDNISGNKNEKKVGIKYIIMLMFFNGPMWLFWLSVCLPEALKLGEKFLYGEYLFIIIFEIFMMLGLATILFGFNFFRKFFTNKVFVNRIFKFLSVAIFFIAIKILYAEINYFFN